MLTKRVKYLCKSIPDTSIWIRFPLSIVQHGISYNSSFGTRCNTFPSNLGFKIKEQMQLNIGHSRHNLILSVTFRFVWKFRTRHKVKVEIRGHLKNFSFPVIGKFSTIKNNIHLTGIFRTRKFLTSTIKTLRRM